jgi:Cu2+-exporting ATPase
VPAGCFHCGEPLGARTWPVTVQGRSEQTCCPGCQAVCGAIVELGLDNYYLHRDQYSARLDQAPVPEDLYARFADETLIESGTVQAATADTRECTLMIEGLRCAACGWLIEKSLAGLPGVQQATVNVTTGRAQVRWSAASLQLRDVLLRLRKLGYRALPFNSAERESQYERERRASLLRLAVGGFGMMQVMMLAVTLYTDFFDRYGIELVYRDYFRAISFLVSTPVVFYAGWPFLRNAWTSTLGGRPGMDVPVAVAILLAYFASLYAIITGGPEVWFDSVCMFVFFLSLGRHLELEARRKATRVVDNLGAALPATANRLQDDGSEQMVPAMQLRAGDRVRVRAGEAIPADGVVREGSVHVDESMLTGEPFPVPRAPGDAVTGGCIVTDGAIVVDIAGAPQQGRLARIVELATRAQAERPALQLLADRIAMHFVVALLVVTALSWFAWQFIDPDRALWIALAVLVVSCPCALSLATPVAFTVATNDLTGSGLLVTRGRLLSTLPMVDTVVFDKTGTLTEGRPRIVALACADGVPEATARRLAARLEVASEHPLATAFLREDAGDAALDVRVVAGGGLEGTVDGVRLRIGSARFALDPSFMTATARSLPAPTDDAHRVWLADDQGPLAWFCLADAPRAGAAETIARLQQAGLQVHLLSGDGSGAVAALAAQLGITQVRGAASPEDKHDHIRQLRAQGRRVLMVGDGINDAPVLAAADVSLAMGRASDLARTSSDGVLLNDRLPMVPAAIATARATARTVRQNLAWSLGYNITMIPLALAGLLPPWLASLGMSASSLVVVFNALRNPQRSRRDPLYPCATPAQNPAHSLPAATPP